nr:MFS transporter [Enterovirga sp. DB1703]
MLREGGVTAHSRAVVITTLGITQILAWGSSYYLLAVLAVPISSDTGWPLPWVVGGLSLGLLVAGLVSPRVGRLVGEHGGRPVLGGSALLLGLGLALLGAAPNLGVYLLAWAVLGAGMGAGLYDAAFSALGWLYREKARSAITHLTLWGGFASTVCWPLSALLVERLGWRGACFVYAAVQIAVSLPLLLVTLRTNAAGASTPRGQTRKVAVSLSGSDHRAFLILAGIWVSAGATTSVVSVHLITLLQESGLSLATAVGLGALVGPSQVAARVVEMAFGGKHHPYWTLAAAMILIALGLVLLWVGLPLPALGLILYGSGNGIYSIARGALPLALFGPDRYPALAGRLAGPGLVAQALAPSLGAVLLARWGAGGTYAGLVVIALINVALVAVLRSQVRPEPVFEGSSTSNAQ